MRALLHRSILAGMLAFPGCVTAWAQDAQGPGAAAEQAGLPAGQPPSDARIRQLVYSEGDVYTITTRYGYQTNLVFSPKETIETISVGDKSVWQIIPAGNRIFIRPMEDGMITNMTVLTNRRSYQFDLKSLGPAETEGNIYVASFIYPEDIIAAAQAAAEAQAQQPPMAMPAAAPGESGMFAGAVALDSAGVSLPPPAPAPAGAEAAPPAAMPPQYDSPAAVHSAPLPPVSPFGGPTPPPAPSVAPAPVPRGAALARLNSEPAPPTTYREIIETPAPAPVADRGVVVPPGANFNYTYSGTDALAPLQVFDDGRFTYLKYVSVDQPLPDAYILDPAGMVRAVPHERQGDYMVVRAVAAEIILKNQSGSVHVYNESLAPQ